MFSIVLIALALVNAAGCGSSSKSSSGSTGTSGGGNTSSCPFSGSTAPQSQPGASKSTQLTSAKPSTSGCIDNVIFSFTPSLASSETAYQAGTNILAVTFSNATLGPGLSSGTEQHPTGLNYVSAVQISASTGQVKISITLDQQRQFLVSSSQVPPQLELSIG